MSQPQEAISVAMIAPPMTQRTFVFTRLLGASSGALANPHVRLWVAAVPHRGQWVQSGASALLHCPQLRSPDVEAPPSVLDGLTLASFAWASSMPFLNSLRLDPSDRASCGSRFAPNRTNTMTRITSSSCDPSPNITETPLRLLYPSHRCRGTTGRADDYMNDPL